MSRDQWRETCAQTSRRLGRSAPATCPCGGAYEALGTDRVGRIVLECLGCGERTTAVPPGTGDAHDPQCPGVVALGGRCACCDRRAAYDAAARSGPVCKICHGPLTGRQSVLCAPCAIVSHRVDARGRKHRRTHG